MSNKQYLIDYWEKSKIVKNKELIKTFKEIPREEFIPAEMIGQAYEIGRAHV